MHHSAHLIFLLMHRKMTNGIRIRVSRPVPMLPMLYLVTIAVQLVGVPNHVLKIISLGVSIPLTATATLHRPSQVPTVMPISIRL